MPFHHPAFFLLFVVTWALYWMVPARLQRPVLLLSSAVFYAYSGLTDTLILIVTVGLNYLLSIRLDLAEPRHRKVWLGAAIALNLSILGCWKYRGFVAENLGLLIPWFSWRPAADRIPLGISFYVFQLIAYQVDLARGQIKRETRPWRLLLYVLFFPHSLAGPIMRPAKLMPQFDGARSWTAAMGAAGGWWILLGLTKKCAADMIAPGVDACFVAAQQGALTIAQAWHAAFGFTFQIYGDFSGYSDMAVGIACLLGYRLDINFRQPYLSQHPSEFWQRWHISLSSWLRDYLFLPVANALGRRLQEERYAGLRTDYVLYAAGTMITMLLGGLWHGAAWMFVLWGALQGLLLVIHRARPKWFKPKPLGIAITFAATMVSWVLFRSSSLGQAWNVIGPMFGIVHRGLDTWADRAGELGWGAALFVAYLAEAAIMTRSDKLAARWKILPAPVRGMVLATAVAAVILSLTPKSSFVYFRF